MAFDSRFADYLHDLGHILYYRHNSQLEHRVMLKPTWITEQIYKVLEDPEVMQNKGRLTKDIIQRVWPKQQVDPDVKAYLLHMMQEFDLAHQIKTYNPAAIEAMVVECLPTDPPAIPVELQTQWNSLAKLGQLQIQFKLEVKHFPPGIPTWFIARKFGLAETMQIYWRFGAWFRTEDGRQMGAVEANDINCTITLTVVGSEPAWFFGALKDTFEDTLKRYPGLEDPVKGIKNIKRSIPCVCQNDETDNKPCSYQFDLDHLLSIRQKIPGKEMTDCQLSWLRAFLAREKTGIAHKMLRTASFSAESN